MNAKADDMCRRALAAGEQVEFLNGQIPEDAPPLAVDDLHEAVE